MKKTEHNYLSVHQIGPEKNIGAAFYVIDRGCGTANFGNDVEKAARKMANLFKKIVPAEISLYDGGNPRFGYELEDFPSLPVEIIRELHIKIRTLLKEINEDITVVFDDE